MGNRLRRPTRPALPALLCLAAAFFFVGGHWMVLQSVAWTRMVIRFSEDASLGTAIARTLDGEHPCALCLRVRAGRAAEEHQTPIAPREQNPLGGPALASDYLATSLLVVVQGEAMDPAFFLRSPSSAPKRRPPVPPPRA